jgi:uncharacterized phage protein gp47/JayE
MELALDSNGFKRKRFAEVFEEMEAKAKEVFGEQVNTSERSPLGIILRIVAFFFGRSWQTAEDVYNSAYRDTASGNNLDRLGPYVGITRIQETYASGTIDITGTVGYTVPAGFRVSTSTNVVFETLASVLLDGSGEGEATIKAVEYGQSGNVAIGLISVIVNPNPNVATVSNAAATAGGREKETDEEFRDRYELSVAGGGAATLDSIRGALLRVSGVRAATVIENTTNTTDGAGRPAKSFEAYVLGGAAADIGQVLLDTKAAGIATYGSESISVVDISGNAHAIKFSFADEINIYVRFTVSTTTSYPANGDALLESAAIRYIGGEDLDGTLYVGLNMGNDVVHSRLVAAAYSVPGVEDVTVELSLNGSDWVTTNIDIDPDEVAQTTYSHVSVVHA